MASLGQPIVLYMGARRIGTITRRLMAGGMTAKLPAALILDATRPEQSVTVTDLGHIAEAVGDGDEDSPALIVIGRIVALRDIIEEAKKKGLLF
jgi:uroporphyrin-III C-methyltransferase